jgi:hypothetical protein
MVRHQLVELAVLVAVLTEALVVLNLQLVVLLLVVVVVEVRVAVEVGVGPGNLASPTSTTQLL